MPSDIEKLQLVVEALNKASGVLSTVQGDLNKFGAATEKTTKKTSEFTKVGRIASGMLMRDFVQGATGAFKSSMKLGTQIGTLEKSFKTLVNQNKAYSLSLESMRAATNGTVSDVDLLTSANQAMLLGLPTEGLDEMFAAAINLGRAMGVDASFAVDSFTKGVGRQSKMILDNLGVVFKAEDANKEYAASIGVAVNALTEEQKSLAWREKAIREVIEASNALGDVTSSGQLAQEQFAASMDNASASVGRFLQPLAGIMPVLDPLMPAIGMMATQLLPSLIGKLGLVSAATTAWATITAIASKAVTIAFLGIPIIGWIAGAIIAFGALYAAISAVDEPVDTFTEEMNKVKEVTTEALTELETNTASQLDALNDVFEEKMTELGDTTEATLKSRLVGRAQGVIEEFKQCVTGKGQDLSGNFEKSMEDLVETTTSLIDAGLVGTAQDAIAAFVECSTDKQATMVEDIDGYLGDLIDSYDENISQITQLVSEGKLEEAAIITRENEGIQSKIAQLEAWKTQILMEAASNVEESYKNQKASVETYLNEITTITQANFAEQGQILDSALDDSIDKEADNYAERKAFLKTWLTDTTKSEAANYTQRKSDLDQWLALSQSSLKIDLEAKRITDEQYKAKMSKLNTDFQLKLRKEAEDHQERISKDNSDYQIKLAKAAEVHETELLKIKKEYTAEFAEIEAVKNKELTAAKDQANTQMKKLESEYTETVKVEAEAQKKALEESYKEEVAALQTKHDDSTQGVEEYNRELTLLNEEYASGKKIDTTETEKWVTDEMDLWQGEQLILVDEYEAAKTVIVDEQEKKRTTIMQDEIDKLAELANAYKDSAPDPWIAPWAGWGAPPGYAQEEGWEEFAGGGVKQGTGPALLHDQEIVFTPDQLKVLKTDGFSGSRSIESPIVIHQTNTFTGAISSEVDIVDALDQANQRTIEVLHRAKMTRIL